MMVNVSRYLADVDGGRQFSNETISPMLAGARSTTESSLANTTTTIPSVEVQLQDVSTCSPEAPSRRRRYAGKTSRARTRPAVKMCTRVEKFTPSEINCTASTEFNWRHGCMQAFDGISFPGKKRNSWASRGQGVGAWIKATFSSKKSIRQLRLLQRNFPGEANKKVEIEFSPCVKWVGTLPARGDTQWNSLTLPRNILAKYVNITVLEVYGHVNNGFKEIEFHGCDKKQLKLIFV